ncbi:MAG: hypothetical protein ACE145_10715 [Terriglobia bacterium]
MNWSADISPSRALPIGALAALVFLGAQSVPAQDALEERYQQGVGFFNNAKMEEACDLLQQVAKEKPDYKQTKTYMNVACSQVKRMFKMEEDLFNEGVQQFNQGKLDDAKQKFEQANKIQLKNPKYRGQASRYLKDIETRLSEERTFQEGVQLFNAGKHTDAFATFEKVARGGGPRAEDARNYVQRLQQLARAQSSPAKPTSKPVSSPGGGPPASQPSAREAPRTVPAQAAESTEPILRAGLQEYFEGKWDDAERDLSDYLNKNGSKRALAFFFRGATRSTRYYLSGQKDKPQKDLAIADFRALKERGAPFDPPAKFVSPQILSIYNEAITAQ